MDEHIEVYTITADQLARASLDISCDSSVILKIWNTKNTAIETSIYHLFTKDDENLCSSQILHASWIRHKNTLLSLLHRNAL